MSDILSGTRLAFLVGGDKKKKSFFQDQEGSGQPVPVDASKPEKLFKPLPRRRIVVANRRGFKAIWIIAGLLTILIPLITRNVKLNMYQNRAWGDVANEYNQYQAQQGNENKFFDLNQCRWWKFGCQPYYVNEKGEWVSEYEMQQEQWRQQYEMQQAQWEEDYQQFQEQQEQQTQYYQQGGMYYGSYNGQPNWYSKWGSTEQERKRAMETGEPTRGLRFVYIWQMVMFIAIILYGLNVIHHCKSAAMLIGILLVWCQCCFLAMFILSEGCIETNEDDWDLSGFYGQFGVLMFMTNAAYASFGLLFTFVFALTAKPQTEEHEIYNESTTNSTGEYKAPVTSPSITQTDAPAKRNPDEDYVKVV